MNEYRVTINTGADEYVYHVDADYRGQAISRAIPLAENDGADPFRRWYFNVEAL